jgi:single-stranded-DNA-specific exonuclease
MSLKPFVQMNEGVAPIVITGNPLLDRIYQNRGIKNPDEINHTLRNLLPPFSMKGMEQACDVIIPHILKKSRILIVGDYDCDGATATSIAVEGLHLLGAHDVRFIVPDRQIHGYGLSPDVVTLAGEYEPDLIITVDNGIASFTGAEEVYKLAHPCELVITDHHLASADGVPRAEAIVNPNQPGCEFKSKDIAGCGVMLYVIIALRSKMRELGIFEERGVELPRIETLLDIAALGTVADVVALDYNNRIIVSAGLEIMNRGEARPGINALLAIAGRKIGEITSMDMGFVVGPRLNAAGRLDDMTHGIRMLLETDEACAAEQAKFLDDFNRQRKEMQKEMVEEANTELTEEMLEKKGIVLRNPEWHEGLVGLAASNVKEKTNRPVICMTDTHAAKDKRQELALAAPSEKERLQQELNQLLIKGSARSVVDVHMKHVLDAINKRAPHILSKFGGHAMAAGMSIPEEHYDEFSRMFDEEVSKYLTDEMILGKVKVDVMDMPESWITMENADLISRAGPWGAKFEEPLFGGNFEVVSFRILKEKHLKMSLRQVGGDMIFDGICFGCIENGEVPFIKTIQCSYSLSINTYKGNSKVQLMVRHLQDPEYVLEKQMKQEFIDNTNVDDKTPYKKLGIHKIIDGKTEMRP